MAAVRAFLVLALLIASLALNGCGSKSAASDAALTPTDTCFAGCLCYRTPEACPGPKAGCYPSYTESVDGSVPEFFCANGPLSDASSQ